MRQLTLKNQSPLPKKEKLKSFLTDNGINVPETFNEFLLTQNPISTSENAIYFDDIDREYIIHAFISFDDNRENSLQNSYDDYVEITENEYLPFAYDMGGWLFMLCIKLGTDFGKVYFYRLDEPIPEGLRLLANSFDEFLDKLETERT